MHGIYFTGLTLFLTIFSLLSSANANDAWIEIPLSLYRGGNSKIKKEIETAELIWNVWYNAFFIFQSVCSQENLFVENR